MNNCFIKISWHRDRKTGSAKDVNISRKANEIEEMTAAAVLARRALEDAAARYGEREAKKAVLNAIRLALELTDEEIKVEV